MSNAFNIEFDYKTFAEVIRQVTKITGETELQQLIVTLIHIQMKRFQY